MKLKAMGLAVAVAGMLSASLPASAVVIHDDNFTDGTGIGPRTGVADNFSVSFTASGTTAFSFELFGARTIDGLGNCCTDVFTLSLDGIDILIGSYDMGGGGVSGEILNTLGLTVVTTSFGLVQGGSTLISGNLPSLAAGLHTLGFKYSSTLQGGNDESWALNDLDVAVSPVPLPPALPLLAAGVGVMALLRRRKQA